MTPAKVILLTPHPGQAPLWADPARRQQRYGSFVMAGVVDMEEVDDIRRNLQRRHAYGLDRCRQAIRHS